MSEDMTLSDLMDRLQRAYDENIHLQDELTKCVRVVRCKDCRWSSEIPADKSIGHRVDLMVNCGACMSRDYLGDGIYPVDRDGYCCMGWRKEGTT